MSKVLDYMMEPQTAVVFDVDGVLAVYEFGELCHSAAPDGDWEAYVRTNDPYASVPAAPPIQRFVQRKGAERVYACSVACDYEAAGKAAFVERNYGIDPSHVQVVASKGDKVDYLRRIADELGLEPARVVLVEDTVKTLDLAMEAGFTTVHVSSFLLA